MPQALIGRNGSIRIANAAFGELLGRAASDLAGLRPRELRHSSDRGGADSTISALLAGERPAGRAERIYAHANGDPIPVLIHLSVLVTDQGEVDGLSAYIQDLRILRASERRLELQEQFYSALGQRGREFAHVLDAGGRFVYASPSVKPLFGYDVNDMVGRYAFDDVHPDDVAATLKEFRSIVQDGGSRTLLFRVAAADGTWRWVQNTMTNLLDSPVEGIVCNLVDVTEQREVEGRLRAAQLRNQAIVDTAREGIWVLAPDGRTEFANERMVEILGQPLPDLREPNSAGLVTDDDAVLLQTRLKERWVRGNEEYELDYRHPDGSVRRLFVAATPIEFGEGAFFGSLAMVTDVTDPRRMEEELRHAALHDPLTGLPNRALFTDRLEQALLNQDETGHDVTLFFVDLDQFKFVNDSRGHEIGDQVLVTVAERLRSLVRPHETVARIGGDEFVVLCTCDHEVSARELGDRICKAIAEPFRLESERIRLTASVGIASSPPYEPANLLRYADTAMFAAKAAGRAQVKVFDRSLAADAERAYAIAHDLRVALEEGSGLEMHYQPLVALATGEVIGYEALARWVHHSEGPISPAIFVPIAEQMGLARTLDRWAVRRSLADLNRLRAAGKVAQGTYIAVNLSAQHLDAELEGSIVAATADAGIPPANISLEITEGAVMRDVVAATRILQSLRDRGYRITIDDFGTGHSSLAYLRDFPISALKIDRSFITHMTDDEDMHAIVTSIVQLGRATRVDVIAEGVETMEQASHLRYLGCAAGQGWLWSRALPMDDMDHFPRRYPPPRGVPGPRRARGGTEDIQEEHGRTRMVQLQAEGASLATIAAALNGEGFRAPNGRRWHQMSVARALSELGE